MAEPEILAGDIATDERRLTAPDTTKPPEPSVSDRLAGALGREQENELSLRRAEQQEMGPARQRLMGAYRDYTRTAETARPKLQDTPDFKPQDLKQDAWQWMSLAGAFGALAGAFSRYHATTALNAFGGMMKGWATGKIEQFNQDYTTWKAHAAKARDANDKALQEYQMILDNKRLSIDQQMAEIQMIGAKYQDQLAISLAQQKNITQLAQLIDKRELQGEQLKLKEEQINLAIAKMEQAADPYSKNLNTPAGAAALAKILSDPNTNADQRRMLAWVISRANPGSTMPELPTADQAKQPGFVESWLGKLFGNDKATASAGATEGAPNAATAGAPAATTAAAPAPAPPAAPAVTPSARGGTSAGASIPPQGMVKLPGTGGRATSGMVSRDGSSPERAITLSTTPAVAAQQASKLPDGTWIIDPRTKQPAQIKRRQPGGSPLPETAAPAAPTPTGPADFYGSTMPRLNTQDISNRLNPAGPAAPTALEQALGG